MEVGFRLVVGPFALQIYYFRHSATRFGGSAQLFEMSPGLKRFSSFSPIYCNFKIRSAAFGISFAERMKIDKEMSNVFAVEVVFTPVIHGRLLMCKEIFMVWI